MNKLPGAVGLGVGLALSSGFFNPAEAHPSSVESVEQALLPECGVRVAYDAFIQAPGFLCSGGEERRGTMSAEAPIVDPVDSDDYRDALIFLGSGLLIAAGAGWVIRREYIKSNQDPDIARAYKDIKKAKEIVVDAEWIVYQAFRSKKQ